MQFNKISLCFKADIYNQIASSLPIPTTRQLLTSSNSKETVIITYELEHTITTAKGFLWVANIKQSMKTLINAPFVFVEYEKSMNEDSSGIKYTLQELQRHFKGTNTTYPSIYYPQDKTSLYQRLCVYAKNLHYSKVFYLEMVVYAGLKMNKALDEPYSYKEIIKKAKVAYDFIDEHKEDLRQKKTARQLKQSLSNGGKIRGEQKKIERGQNMERIKCLTKDDRYIKPNGKPYILKIANELNLNKETVSRILKMTSCVLSVYLILWSNTLSLNILHPTIIQ
jgi:hypothetical protein